MEDILQFLLIIGVILVGVFKEVTKNYKSKKAATQRPVSTIPSPAEIDPDNVPLPEAWGKIELPLPQESSRQSSRDSSRQHTFQQPQKQQKKKREEVSVASSLANSAAQDKLNSRQGAHYDVPEGGTSDNNQDFTIHSAEEARRAIIWGEILQRKY